MKEFVFRSIKQQTKPNKAEKPDQVQLEICVRF